jgi:hypothetical protein
VAPYGVVTVTVLGLGMWMVPVPPDGVWTVTELSHDGMVMVAVPPLWVTTWEMMVGVRTGNEVVPPDGVWMEMELTDELGVKLGDDGT